MSRRATIKCNISTFWPEPEEVEDGRNPGMNLSYYDMRECDWDEVIAALELETELLRKIRMSSSPYDDEDSAIDQNYEDISILMFGLDIGVATVVCALSAVGCIPISSCNGGTLGGNHHEDHPLVVFFANDEHVDTLTRAARHAGINLDIDRHTSGTIAYCDGLDEMMEFGRRLIPTTFLES